MEKSVQVIIEQSLLDIAIQQCGDATAVFDLAVLNGLAITDALETGQLIVSDAVLDDDVARYYSERNIKPTTGFSEEDKIITANDEGIAYWAIGVDFIVQ